MRKTLLLLMMCVTSVVAFAAASVQWSCKLVGDGTASPSVEITEAVPAGYHLYAQDNPAGGGSPLKIYVEGTGVKADGKPTANRVYTKAYNDIF